MPGPHGQAWPALPVVCLIYVTSSDLMVPSVANKPFHPAALLLSAAQKGLTGPWQVAATPPHHGCLAGPGDTFPSLACWAGLGGPSKLPHSPAGPGLGAHPGKGGYLEGLLNSSPREGAPACPRALVPVLCTHCCCPPLNLPLCPWARPACEGSEQLL